MAMLPPTHGQLVRGPKPPRDRAADRRYDEGRRDDLARRIRSSARWQKMRALQIAREPLCRECARRGVVRAATQVDHIEPLRLRPELAFVRSNLQSLCDPCTGRKNAEERRGS